MAYLESFKSLIKIYKIDEKIKIHQDALSELNKRIDHLKKLRTMRQEEVELSQKKDEGLKSDLAEKEKDLFDKESRLSKLKENLTQVVNVNQESAIQKEMNLLMEVIDQIENISFEILEEIELQEQIIKDGQEFLTGSLETIDEINVEIAPNFEEHQGHIQTFEKEQNDFFHQCQKQVILAHKRPYEKYRFRKPFSFIKDMKCGQCSFFVGAEIAKKVETANEIEFCSSCERVLFPLKSFDYRV